MNLMLTVLGLWLGLNLALLTLVGAAAFLRRHEPLDTQA